MRSTVSGSAWRLLFQGFEVGNETVDLPRFEIGSKVVGHERLVIGGIHGAGNQVSTWMGDGIGDVVGGCFRFSPVFRRGNDRRGAGGKPRESRPCQVYPRCDRMAGIAGGRRGAEERFPLRDRIGGNGSMGWGLTDIRTWN